MTLNKLKTTLLRFLLLASVLLLLNSCAVGYYWQAGAGQMRISRGQQPVEELLATDELSELERERLELSRDALEFAHSYLLLPDNGSYRKYFDTGQPYVVWNVFAAPEFSLEPQTWCFPVAGCIAYRGYFKEASARKYADKLATKGSDVFVGGVSAYSTLGKLKDPLLNTMLSMSEADFVGLLFHELAHQRIYIKDDSAFNEGFATAVEQAGVRRWRLDQQLQEPAERESTARQRKQVVELLRTARARLKELYASDIDDAAMREQKAALLTELQDDYRELEVAWEAAGLNGRPYGGLFRRGFNNASLSAIATYDDYVPAFQVVLDDCSGDFTCFYERAEELGDLDADERAEAMQQLQARHAVVQD